MSASPEPTASEAGTAVATPSIVLSIAVANGDAIDFPLPESGLTVEALLDLVKVRFSHTTPVPRSFLALVDNDQDSVNFATQFDAKVELQYDENNLGHEEQEPVLGLFCPVAEKMLVAEHSGEFLLLVLPVEVPSPLPSPGRTYPRLYLEDRTRADTSAIWFPQLILRPDVINDSRAMDWVLRQVADAVGGLEESQKLMLDGVKFWKAVANCRGRFLFELATEQGCKLHVDGLGLFHYRDRFLGLDLWTFLLKFNKKAGYFAVINFLEDVYGTSKGIELVERARDLQQDQHCQYGGFIGTPEVEPWLELPHEVTYCARGWVDLLEWKLDILSVQREAKNEGPISMLDHTEERTPVLVCLFKAALRYQQKEVLHLLADRFPRNFLSFAKLYRTESGVITSGEYLGSSSTWFRNFLHESSEAECACLTEVVASLTAKRVTTDTVAAKTKIESHTTATSTPTEDAGEVTELRPDETLGLFPSGTVPSSQGRKKLVLQFPATLGPTDGRTDQNGQQAVCTATGLVPLHKSGCKCAKCGYALSRVKEYGFYVRRKLSKVIPALAESRVLQDLFPGRGALHIDTKGYEGECEKLISHDLSKIEDLHLLGRVQFSRKFECVSADGNRVMVTVPGSANDWARVTSRVKKFEALAPVALVPSEKSERCLHVVAMPGPDESSGTRWQSLSGQQGVWRGIVPGHVVNVQRNLDHLRAETVPHGSIVQHKRMSQVNGMPGAKFYSDVNKQCVTISRGDRSGRWRVSTEDRRHFLSQKSKQIVGFDVLTTCTPAPTAIDLCNSFHGVIGRCRIFDRLRASRFNFGAGTTRWFRF
ncbi:unnamed protein product [Amoebophrya sp. A120]|nr:unnamed protein product [Amoebophrya sp. A120]|eukprot:GSA120T00005693001.1